MKHWSYEIGELLDRSSAPKTSKWDRKNFPGLCDLRVEQVELMGGNFFASSSRYANETLSDASWFVPYESALPVMIRKSDGTWEPRGF